MTDNYYTGSVKCRDKILTFGKETVCMGILNVTPDSFSDGGRNYKFTDAMMNVKSMIEDGAKVNCDNKERCLSICRLPPWLRDRSGR